MFGFLIGGEVNDDAVALKKLTDMVMNKYAALEHDQLIEAISRDFDEEHRYIDSNDINFFFKELEEFQFGFRKSYGNEAINDLSIFGRGKYAGVLLQVTDGKNWYCSVSDGIAYRATGGAKKLVKVLEKKFDIQDISNVMKGFR
jgi:hypothetical protein